MSENTQVRVITMDHTHLQNYVSCYRHIYGEAGAWREFKTCSDQKNCGKKWSIQEWSCYLLNCHKSGHYVETCDNCGSSVMDCWSRDDVTKDILDNVLNHPHGIGFVLINKSQVVGFINGFGGTLGELRSTETIKKIPGLVEAIEENFGKEVITEKIFYQAELGVMAPYCEQGFGKKLFGYRLVASISKGYKLGFYRTNPEAKSLPLGGNYGFKNILEYEIPGDGADGRETRVIMASLLDEALTIFRERDGNLLPLLSTQ